MMKATKMCIWWEMEGMRWDEKVVIYRSAMKSSVGMKNINHNKVLILDKTLSQGWRIREMMDRRRQRG